jgi:hypothetical protein
MLLLHGAPAWGFLDTVFSSAIIGCVMAVLFVMPASPQVYTYSEDGFTFNAGIKAALGGVATGNTNFGAGTVRPNGSVDHNVAYAEGYLLPKINLSYDTGSFGTTYGAVAGVAAATRGGDPGNFTFDSPSDIDLDQLYGGWKSGNLFSSLGDDAIDISAGRQYFQIGDGFIVWDGNLDEGHEAAYWLAPRFAFDMTGIVKFNTKPVSGSAFYLKADANQDHSQLAGGNVEYKNEKLGSTFGFTYFQIFESDNKLTVRRDGMNVADVRVWDIPVPYLPNLTLRGEFVYQWGDGKGTSIDANGWYAAATYSFTDILPWKPTLTYRYSFFSGDGNPADSTSNAFDSLFYSSPTGWGTWFQGEIVGEYLLFNSNQITHMVNLNVSPTDSLSFGLLFFDFTLDKDNYLGTPVSDKHFATEVNLYMNWNITDHVYFAVVGELAWPGVAAKEVFGSSDTYELIESQLVVTY